MILTFFFLLSINESFFLWSLVVTLVSSFRMTDLFSLVVHFEEFYTVVLCFSRNYCKSKEEKDSNTRFVPSFVACAKRLNLLIQISMYKYCIFHKTLPICKCMLILPIIIVTVEPVIYFCTFLTSNSVSLYILLPLFRPAVFGLYFRRELSLFVMYTFLVPTCVSSHFILKQYWQLILACMGLYSVLLSFLTFLKLYWYCARSLTRKNVLLKCMCSHSNKWIYT